MTKTNKTLWIILAMIPYVNSLSGLIVLFITYDRLKIIYPETKRSVGKDILFTILSLGLFTLILPYFLISDTRKGAERLGIEIPDYLGLYYALFVPGFLLGFYIGFAPFIGIDVSDIVNYPIYLGMIISPITIYLYLQPFDIIVDSYAEE